MDVPANLFASPYLDDIKVEEEKEQNGEENSFD
jgi:hypothetical protein